MFHSGSVAEAAGIFERLHEGSIPRLQEVLAAHRAGRERYHALDEISRREAGSRLEREDLLYATRAVTEYLREFARVLREPLERGLDWTADESDAVDAIHSLALRARDFALDDVPGHEDSFVVGLDRVAYAELSVAARDFALVADGFDAAYERTWLEKSPGFYRLNAQMQAYAGLSGELRSPVGEYDFEREFPVD